MSNEKILIVDDEADIALILKLQLEDVGYRTVRARDGMEALELLGRERFSLILLDIRMPRMDGIQALERIRCEYPDLVVVMMTAHGSEDIAVEAMKKGAVDYISKPFSSDDMKKRVERAIEHNRTRLENERLQRQIYEERQKMEAILRGMADMLVAVDRQGLVMTVNRKGEELLGIDARTIYGNPVEEVVKSDISSDRLPCRVVLRTGEPCLDVTYEITHAGGTIPVLSSAAPLKNSSGEMIGSVEIIRDISALKALEQEKEDFVSMLSHDLKTPLTAVVGSIDLVREGRLGKVNAEQKTYLESAIESCSDMVEMIDTLLDVHKFEAGKMTLNFREELPKSLLERSLERFESVARRAEIRLLSTLREPLPPFPVDRGKFFRLMGNLLSNAFKFTPEGGEIEVLADMVKASNELWSRIPKEVYPLDSLPEKGQFVRVMVRDTGTGIPAEALVTIFDRFVQAKNRRRGKTAGTGLGLAFCRKVMDAHGGYVWAESELDKGSTFTMLFPLER